MFWPNTNLLLAASALLVAFSKLQRRCTLSECGAQGQRCACPHTVHTVGAESSRGPARPSGLVCLTRDRPPQALGWAPPGGKQGPSAPVAWHQLLSHCVTPDAHRPHPPGGEHHHREAECKGQPPTPRKHAPKTCCSSLGPSPGPTPRR